MIIASVAVFLACILSISLYYKNEQLFSGGGNSGSEKANSKEKYPGKMQAYSELYKNKCSACHELSKSKRASNIMPSDWDKVVKRMAQLPDSHISPSEEQQIVEFLIYDSATRRKSKLEAGLKKLSQAEREAEQARIDQVLQSD